MQRDRAAAGLRDRAALPRRAGGALLRAPRRDGDGARRRQQARIGEGGAARVDASTVRKIRNTSDSEDPVYVVIGGKDGYVGRDGRLPEGETRR